MNNSGLCTTAIAKDYKMLYEGVNSIMKKRLELKDIMNVGIFVVIYYITFFASMCVGYFPPAMPFLSVVSGVLCGIPFMVFLAKIKKPSCILLFGTVCGLISLTMGSGAMPLAFAVAVSLICELLMYCFKYKASIKYVIVYMVFTLWNLGYGIRLYLSTASSYVDSLNEGYGEEYVSSMLDYVTGVTFWSCVGLCLLGGLLGGLLGFAIFRKHFKKIEMSTETNA